MGIGHFLIYDACVMCRVRLGTPTMMEKSEQRYRILPYKLIIVKRSFDNLLGNSTYNFKKLEPVDIQTADTKVRDDSSNDDAVPSDKKTLPRWVKYIIAVNLIAVHLVVILTGIKDIPFELGEGALAAYIVVGLGTPIGLAHQAI